MKLNIYKTLKVQTDTGLAVDAENLLKMILVWFGFVSIIAAEIKTREQ